MSNQRASQGPTLPAEADLLGQAVVALEDFLRELRGNFGHRTMQHQCEEAERVIEVGRQMLADTGAGRNRS